jgi:hypothetical protein
MRDAISHDQVTKQMILENKRSNKTILGPEGNRNG